MDYLNRILKIQVRYNENWKCEHLPNFIMNRYLIKKAYLDNQAVFFIYPQTELDQISNIKKQILRIQKIEKLPVILILKKLTYRQKMYLLDANIPFIVEGKQIYLPFMAVYLQEQCDAEEEEVEKLLPSAQVLLFFFIYENKKELLSSHAAEALGFTPTSIFRAVKQLEKTGLIQTEKRGVQKIITSPYSSKELLKKAEPYLINPVRRKVFIPSEYKDSSLLESGYSALSEYTMLNPPTVACYAAETVSQWSSVSTKKLLDSNRQIAVELWKYDPRKLAKGNFVDILSLSLLLKMDLDERVEDAVEEMLIEFWRVNDGTRS